MKQLTERMKAICAMVPKSKAIADIGADHALISIALAEGNKAEKIYACDINEGPVEAARANVLEKGLSDKVTVMLSDGLSDVYDKADTAIIAGMGGELIAEILKRADISGIKSFILQPMSRADKLRGAFSELGLKTEDEVLVLDAGRIYTVIHAVHGCEKLSRAELLLGPAVIKKRGPLFLNHAERIIRYEMSKTNNEDERKFREENIRAVREVIENGNGK